MKKNTFCTLMFRRTGEVLKVRFVNYQILGEGAKKLTEGFLATLHSSASFGTLGQNWFFFRRTWLTDSRQPDKLH